MRRTEESESTQSRYRVIATVDTHLLAEMRDALSAIRPLSAVVSPAVSWSGAGKRYSFRGGRYRRDREVVRIEIVCDAQQVDWIEQAIGRVLDKQGPRAHAQGLVVTHRIDAREPDGQAETVVKPAQDPSSDGDRQSYDTMS